MAHITDELPKVLGVPMKWALTLMKLITTISGFTMAFTFFFVVVIRYGFGGDLFAYEEWLLAIAFWGFFAGAVLASEQRLHINADILGVIIQNPRLIWWRELFVLTIELIVILAIVYWGYLMLADELYFYPRWKMTPALRIPFFVWRAAIVAGFVLMSTFSAAYLYVHIRKGLGLPTQADTTEEVEQ